MIKLHINSEAFDNSIHNLELSNKDWILISDIFKIPFNQLSASYCNQSEVKRWLRKLEDDVHYFYISATNSYIKVNTGEDEFEYTGVESIRLNNVILSLKSILNNAIKLNLYINWN